MINSHKFETLDTTELYFPVEDVNGYEISNYGNIRKQGQHQTMKTTRGTIRLNTGEKYKTFQMSRLMATTFLNNFDNNHLNNIVWYEHKNDKYNVKNDTNENCNHNIKINEILGIMFNCDIKCAMENTISLNKEEIQEKLEPMSKYFKDNCIFFKLPKTQEITTIRALVGRVNAELNNINLHFSRSSVNKNKNPTYVLTQKQV
jgi:hypothetical protein